MIFSILYLQRLSEFSVLDTFYQSLCCLSHEEKAKVVFSSKNFTNFFRFSIDIEYCDTCMEH